MTFTVTTLASSEARSVYPLIREAVPGLDLAAWLKFARQLTAPRKSAQSGIVVARRAGRPFPCGLFCYRVDNDLERGRVLSAEHFVAVDLLEPDAVLAALVAELEALGKRMGCTAVRSLVHGEERAVVGGLFAAGHAPQAALLGKTLGGDYPHPGGNHGLTLVAQSAPVD
jgi:hypothetical protein